MNETLALIEELRDRILMAKQDYAHQEANTISLADIAFLERVEISLQSSAGGGDGDMANELESLACYLTSEAKDYSADVCSRAAARIRALSPTEGEKP